MIHDDRGGRTCHVDNKLHFISLHDDKSARMKCLKLTAAELILLELVLERVLRDNLLGDPNSDGITALLTQVRSLGPQPLTQAPLTPRATPRQPPIGSPTPTLSTSGSPLPVFDSPDSSDSSLQDDMDDTAEESASDVEDFFQNSVEEEEFHTVDPKALNVRRSSRGKAKKSRQLPYARPECPRKGTRLAKKSRQLPYTRPEGGGDPPSDPNCPRNGTRLAPAQSWRQEAQMVQSNNICADTIIGALAAPHVDSTSTSPSSSKVQDWVSGIMEFLQNPRIFTLGESSIGEVIMNCRGIPQQMSGSSFVAMLTYMQLSITCQR